MTMFCAVSALGQDCEQAEDLVIEAYDGGQAGMSADEQQALLERALQRCPDYPAAHNNIGVILENEGRYEQALTHYKQAVQLQPDFAEAWFGIGEVYEKMQQFPLSLEAYLHGCQDVDARMRIKDLLRTQRFQISEEGEVLNKESLLALFDPERRAWIRTSLKDCGFKAGVRPEYILRNIQFDEGLATLTTESLPQLEQFGEALRALDGVTVTIAGHTDKQWFKGVDSEEENYKLNLRLSKNRAETVAEYLSGLGIPRQRFQTQGYGWNQPMLDEDSEEAYAKNRRVNLEIPEH